MSRFAILFCDRAHGATTDTKLQSAWDAIANSIKSSGGDEEVKPSAKSNTKPKPKPLAPSAKPKVKPKPVVKSKK
jgi:hypothetical protein